MNIMLAAFGFGGWEVVLILAVVLILFGAKKLPELAKGLGQGIKEFKKATRDVNEEMQNAMREEEPPQKRIPAATVPTEPVPTQPAATPQPTPGQKA